MHFDITKIKHLAKDIDLTIVDTILESAKLAPKNDAEVANIVDGEYVKAKKSEYCNASLVDYSEFADQVDDLIEYCATRIKNQYNLTCVDKTVEFVYYTTGTKYWPHVDGQAINKNIATRGNIKRDITCVVYFNDDYAGGELNFTFFDKEIRPSKGDIILYPSSWQYMHGVNTVIGERYALVIWFQTDPHAYPLEDEVITDQRILRTLTAVVF